MEQRVTALYFSPTHGTRAYTALYALGAGDSLAMLAGMLSVVLLRFLSAYFRWNLPRPSPRRDS